MRVLKASTTAAGDYHRLTSTENTQTNMFLPVYFPFLYPSTSLPLSIVRELMSLERPLSFVSIAVLHSLSTKFETQLTNLSMRALSLATISGAYLDSWVNFSAYSSTVILCCLKFINFTSLASLHSWGKNLYKNIIKNSSFSTRPAPFHLTSFHYLYQIWATLFNW